MCNYTTEWVAVIFHFTGYNYMHNILQLTVKVTSIFYDTSVEGNCYLYHFKISGTS